MRGLFEAIRGAFAGSQGFGRLGSVCARQHKIVQCSKACYQLSVNGGSLKAAVDLLTGEASSISVDGKIFDKFFARNKIECMMYFNHRSGPQGLTTGHARHRGCARCIKEARRRGVRNEYGSREISCLNRS